MPQRSLPPRRPLDKRGEPDRRAGTDAVTVSKRVTRRVNGHLRDVTIKVKKTVPQPLQVPTTITGQNGAQLTQTTKIAVTGCPKTKAKSARNSAARTPKKRR